MPKNEKPTHNLKRTNEGQNPLETKKRRLSNKSTEKLDLLLEAVREEMHREESQDRAELSLGVETEKSPKQPEKEHLKIFSNRASSLVNRKVSSRAFYSNLPTTKLNSEINLEKTILNGKELLANRGPNKIRGFSSLLKSVHSKEASNSLANAEPENNADHIGQISKISNNKY